MESLFNNLSTLTKKVRIAYLKSIGVKSLDDYEALKNVKQIRDAIEKSTNKQTRKTRVFHVIEFLKVANDVALLKPYTDMMIEYKGESDKAEADNKLVNDDKRDRYVKLYTLKNQLTQFEPVHIKPEEATLKYIKQYQKYLILSFYVFNPPIRNDLSMLEIIPNQKKITKQGNYLIVNNRNVFLYLNEFKNSKSFGSVKVGLDNRVIQAIKYILKLYKAIGLSPKYLINSISEDSGISEATEAATLQMIIRYSKEVFGIKLSINDYRHIWEIFYQNQEWYKAMSIAEREDLHRKLLHGMSTALLYNRV